MHVLVVIQTAGRHEGFLKDSGMSVNSSIAASLFLCCSPVQIMGFVWCVNSS